jgi:hypothetical protein
MALDVLVTTDRISNDPVGRDFISYLRANATELSLEDGALYYDFPTYSDYETVAHRPDLLLVSACHGLLAIRLVNGLDPTNLTAAMLTPIDESLAQFCSILIGRLLKSRVLRRGLSNLLFDVTPLLFVSSARQDIELSDLENTKVVRSQMGFEALLSTRKSEPLSHEMTAEIRSVIEGAKALTRPQKRIIENPDRQKPAAALVALEAEIANFDQRQRKAALVTIPGPQRIRELAGSGKTVILAMKAAHLHLTRPEEKILVTFFTRSLRTSLKTLITRFFRNYKDEDPDWNRIHIRHGWGGATLPGVYSDAARRHSLTPLTFGAARQTAFLVSGMSNDRCSRLRSVHLIFSISPRLIPVATANLMTGAMSLLRQHRAAARRRFSSPGLSLRSRLWSGASSLSLSSGFSFRGSPHSSLATSNRCLTGVNSRLSEVGLMAWSRWSRYLAKSSVRSSESRLQHIWRVRKTLRTIASVAAVFFLGLTVSL